MFSFITTHVCHSRHEGYQASCISEIMAWFHVAGGPGSGKGRLVANLRSMFGMKLVSIESIILKYLPKKVAHTMTLNSVDVSVRLILYSARTHYLYQLGNDE